MGSLPAIPESARTPISTVRASGSGRGRSSKAIADGASILDYLRATLAASGSDGRVRLHHRVLSADLASRLARWTVEIERADTGERLTRTARWLFSAAGYYRYNSGYTPELRGLAHFAGPGWCTPRTGPPPWISPAARS